MAAKRKPETKLKASSSKSTTKKSADKKIQSAPEKPMKKGNSVTEAMTKTQMLNIIAENTELSRKQVSAVLDQLSSIIERHITKRGVGNFTLPGLMKIQVARKPATKARKGVNPFTGEETIFKAKPARNVVKIRPLKKMKEMVN